MKITFRPFMIGLFLSASLSVEGQNVVISDQSTATADNSAMLDVQAANKGVLFPRMNTAAMNLITNPAVGLLIFNTETESFWYNTAATGWTNLGGVITVDNTLTGDGSTSSPLGLAQNGASNNDILSWNGTNWAPSASPWLTNGNSIVYTPNRKVGIGLNTPIRPLHVKGDILSEENTAGDEGGLGMLDNSGFARVYLNHEYSDILTRLRFELYVPNPSGVAQVQFFRLTDAQTKRAEFFRGKGFGTAVSATIGVDQENSFFQVHGGNLGVGTDTPDPNAILDVSSDAKGVLFPQMSTTQRIALGNATPKNGLLVFDKNTNTYWYWVDNAWVELSGGSGNASAVPAGTILPYAGSTIPSGYLACDGSAVSPLTYPNLYNAIGIIWGGVVDISFNLPDLRGQFLRGYSESSNEDPDKNSRFAKYTGGATGNNIGSYQSDELVSHNHTLIDGSDTDAGGPEVRPVLAANNTISQPSTGNTGGNETRPKNANVFYIIKF